MELFRLFGSILIDNDAADRSLAQTDQKAENVGNTLTKGIGTAAKWGFGLAAAASAGVVALLGVATKASETAAEIDDMANKTNMSASSLQQWKYAAEQSGFSLDTIEGSAVKLTKTLGNYASGSKATIDAFKQLGVSATDSNGKLRTTNDVFPEIISSLADMTDITERDALSMAIFGKSAMDMSPMLNEGSAGIDEMKAKASELGLVMGDDAIAAGAKFDDMMATVKSSLGAMVTKVGTDVLPIIQQMLEWVTTNMPTIQAVTSVVFGVISDVIQVLISFINDKLVPAFNDFWLWLQPNMPAIQSFVVNTFEAIKTILSVLGEFVVTYIIPIFISLKDWFVANFPVMKDAVMQAYNYIKPSLDELVKVISEKVIPILQDWWDKVQLAMPAIKVIFEVAFVVIVQVIKTVIDNITLFIEVVSGIYNILSPVINFFVGSFVDSWNQMKDAVSSVGSFINGVISGIKNGFKGMVNGVISGLNTMIRGLNKLSFTVPDWVPGFGGDSFGFNLGEIPSYAVGTRYLPNDMLVQAHEGEMIVPKSENPYANSTPGNTLPTSDNKQPLILKFILPNGKTIAEFIASDINGIQGEQSILMARGSGL